MSSTEPGDFVEFDMDLLEAERRTIIRAELDAIKPVLEADLGTDLHITNDGNNLVLADADGVRFRASLSADGRLTLTDERLGELL